MFNPDDFLNTTVTGANSTTMKPIPEHEARGYVKDVKAREAKGRAILDVTWVVDSEEARKATNLPEPTVRQSIFLDISESGGLDMSEGKNVALGRLRKAVGQNDGAWSPSMLIGKTAKIQVSQRADKDDSSKVYNDIKSVTAA